MHVRTHKLEKCALDPPTFLEAQNLSDEGLYAPLSGHSSNAAAKAHSPALQVVRKDIQSVKQIRRDRERVTSRGFSAGWRHFRDPG